MSSSAANVIMIPARLTAQNLAEAIDRPITEVQAVLGARQEPAAPDDYLSADLAIAVAETLGVDVSIEARDMALECLYQWETVGELGDLPPGRAGKLTRGVVEDLDDLDASIESVAEHWSVARMPIVDRNVIRLGLFELLSEPETSTAVIVSEAVRLAQTYSTEKSASFVNGVLASLAKEVRGR